MKSRPQPEALNQWGVNQLILLLIQELTNDPVTYTVFSLFKWNLGMFSPPRGGSVGRWVHSHSGPRSCERSGLGLLVVRKRVNSSAVRKWFNSIAVRKRFDSTVVRKRFDSIAVRKEFDSIAFTKWFNSIAVSKRFDSTEVKKRFNSTAVRKRFDCRQKRIRLDCIDKMIQFDCSEKTIRLDYSNIRSHDIITENMLIGCNPC